MIRDKCAFWALSAAANILDFTVCNKALTILTYHRVLDAPDPLRPSEPDIELFRWQMALIEKYFNVLRLDEALAHLKSGSLPRKALCVTFDDGYKDNYRNALPVLKNNDIDATFFIATDFLGGGIMWNDAIIESIRLSQFGTLDLRSFGLGEYPVDTIDQKRVVIRSIIDSWKYLPQDVRNSNVVALVNLLEVHLPDDFMMDSTEVVALHEQGMEIGGHTMSHPILANETTEKAFLEISQGKDSLEKMINAPVTTFAYPNGRWGKDYNKEHVYLVEKAGYSGAVSTDPGVSRPKDDVYRLSRTTPWERQPGKFYFRLIQNMIA